MSRNRILVQIRHGCVAKGIMQTAETLGVVNTAFITPKADFQEVNAGPTYSGLFSRSGLTGSTLSDYFIASRMAYIFGESSSSDGYGFYGIAKTIELGYSCVSIDPGYACTLQTNATPGGSNVTGNIRPVVDVSLSDTILGQDGAGTAALPYILWSTN